MIRIAIAVLSLIFAWRFSNSLPSETKSYPIGQKEPQGGPSSMAVQKPSCPQPLYVQSKTTENGTATLVADGRGCLYTSTSLDTCDLSLDFGQLEFDVNVSGNCSEEEWMSVWYDPRPYQSAREVDFLETYTGYPSGLVFTNFGSEGHGSIWVGADNMTLSAKDGFSRHVTAWTLPAGTKGTFGVDLFVKNCATPTKSCDPSKVAALAYNESDAKGAIAWRNVAHPHGAGLFVLDNWGQKGMGAFGKTSPGCQLSVTNLLVYTCGRSMQKACNNACSSPVLGQANDTAIMYDVTMDKHGKCVAKQRP
jgi:hypothetical protein